MQLTDQALQLLAPDGTTYNLQGQHEPPQELWNPNWETFYERLYNQEISITNNCINIMLSIESLPVPESVMQIILDEHLHTLDEKSLYLITRNSHISKEVYCQILEKVSQSKMIKLQDIVSTKLLHEASKFSNVNAAQSIIEYYPSALWCRDRMGLLPLHVAFSYQNTSNTSAGRRSDIIRVLIQQGQKHCNHVKGKGILASGVFTEHSSIVGSGGTPFELSLYYLRQKYYSKEATSHQDQDCQDEWECLKLCYQAAKASSKNFQLIHYIISYHVSMERMIPDIVKKFDIDLSDCIDKDGFAPLAIAIKEQKASYIRCLLSLHNGAAIERIPYIETNRKYKQSRSRLPLHMALATGLKWTMGLKEIIENNMCALEERDEVTGLFPFMLAAQSKDHAMDDIFYLLKNNLNVLYHSGDRDSFSKRKKYLIINQTFYVHVILGLVLGVFCYILFSHTIEKYML